MNEIIKKNGILFGVITGILGALITTLIYIINLELFISMWVGLTSLLLYIIIGIVLLTKTKKELKGIFSFKDAFTTYFISAVIGILISVVFNIILFNLIDPAVKETLKELTIKYMTETMQRFNSPQSAINDAMTKLQENDPYSVIELIKGTVFKIAFSALFGLLLALVFKSNTTQE
ncbi:MAG TPA: DUF4199 domain-containing protein [Flavobacterium sp.]